MTARSKGVILPLAVVGDTRSETAIVFSVRRIDAGATQSLWEGWRGVWTAVP